MAEKPFISYGNQQPVAIHKIKSFKRNINNIDFIMDSGVISWAFSSNSDADFAHKQLLSRFVSKLNTRMQKEAQDKKDELDEISLE